MKNLEKQRLNIDNITSLPSPRKCQELIDEFLKVNQKKNNLINSTKYLLNSPAIERNNIKRCYTPYKHIKFQLFENPRLPIISSSQSKSIFNKKHDNSLFRNMDLIHSYPKQTIAVNKKIHCLVDYDKSKKRIEKTINKTEDQRFIKQINPRKKLKYMIIPINNETSIEKFRNILKGSMFRLQTFVKNDEGTLLDKTYHLQKS